MSASRLYSACSKLRFYFVHTPGSFSTCSPLYKGITMLEKNMHTPGVHPTEELCTQGAGCTLNFEHCLDIFVAITTKRISMFCRLKISNYKKLMGFR